MAEPRARLFPAERVAGRGEVELLLRHSDLHMFLRAKRSEVRGACRDVSTAGAQPS